MIMHQWVDNWSLAGLVKKSILIINVIGSYYGSKTRPIDDEYPHSTEYYNSTYQH